MRNWKDIPKVKKGKWFVYVRGSYLPATPQAWLLHALLFFCAIGVILMAFDDNRSILVASTAMTLELIGLGALFTLIASKKS